MMATGCSNKESAVAFSITERTATTEVDRILAKLTPDTSADAAARAAQHDLV